MRSFGIKTLWTILLIFTSTILAQYYYNNDAVLLEQTKVLTFNKGQMTTGRRSAPLQQIQCVGGSASGHTEYYPSAVQCTNVGSNGFDVEWRCEADLDSSVRFGQTTVNCEGYSNPDDPNILKGSCSLEYILEYTEQGRQKNQQSGYFHNYNTSHYHDTSSGIGTVFMFIVLVFIIIGILKQCNQNGSYGQGDNTTYDPPRYPGYPPSGYPSSGYPSSGYPSTGYPSSGYPSTGYPSYPTTTWRPGFWSGFGTGGLMGYLFRPRTGYYGNTYAPSYGPTYGSRTSFGSGSFGSGSSFASSSPRTATAFASTRRR